MSATIVYAAVIILLMSFFSACARTAPRTESKRARATCRSGAVAKRTASWSPPRVRF